MVGELAEKNRIYFAGWMGRLLALPALSVDARPVIPGVGSDLEEGNEPGSERLRLGSLLLCRRRSCRGLGRCFNTDGLSRLTDWKDKVSHALFGGSNCNGEVL